MIMVIMIMIIIVVLIYSMFNTIKMKRDSYQQTLPSANT